MRLDELNWHDGERWNYAYPTGNMRELVILRAKTAIFGYSKPVDKGNYSLNIRDGEVLIDNLDPITAQAVLIQLLREVTG